MNSLSGRGLKSGNCRLSIVLATLARVLSGRVGDSLTAARLHNVRWLVLHMPRHPSIAQSSLFLRTRGNHIHTNFGNFASIRRSAGVPRPLSCCRLVSSRSSVTGLKGAASSTSGVQLAPKNARV